MLPIKRPKPGDTEEDLLQQEKEFLEGLKSSKITPAAKVVRIGKQETGLKSVPESSYPGDAAGAESLTGSARGDADSAGHGNEEFEHPSEPVLFSVKERAFDPSRLKDFSEMVAHAPKMPRLKLEPDFQGQKATQPGIRKKSLFAKSFDKRKENSLKISSEPLKKQAQERGELENAERTSECSATIGDKIHPYLAGMTEDEILEEQRKLLERLDPKLVNFIRNRKHGKPTDPPPDTPAKPQEKDTEMQVEVDEADIPIDPKVVENFPRMDKLEHAKLAWAGSVKEEPASLGVTAQAGSKNARFDFMGLLLPEDASSDPKTYEGALHNHGEEMHRPGYTVEELMTLARSVHFQQRAIALETLGNIYVQAHTGIYDEVFESSIFNLLDFMDFIYTIRKGLDNSDSGSINSSLKCLASLLYPEQEENCLDATVLWPNSHPQPLLITKPEEFRNDKQKETELKDFEFVQLDLLDFLLRRTEILTRMEYLLTTKSELLNEEGVTSALKVLIRLARHSPGSVIKHDKLLKYIVQNHVSANWIALNERDKGLKGIPLVHALKLMRILVESSACNARKLYLDYGILPSVMSYLAYDQWKEQTHVLEVENLVLESFKIWSAFLHHGFAIDEYVAFFPILMQFLRFYGVSDALNSFDLSHSAHLFGLLSGIVCFGQNSSEENHSHWALVKDAVSLVEQHCIKVSRILSAPHLQNTYNMDLSLLSLGKGLEFLSLTSKYSNTGGLSPPMLNALRAFGRSNIYEALTLYLTSHSILLQTTAARSRYPSNFASINAVNWTGKLNPLMRACSPFHFITYFVSYLKRLTESPLGIILNPTIEIYLEKLRAHGKFAEHSDYFVRFELSCLYEILSVLPKESNVKFPVSYKALAEVPLCCRTVFQNILRVSLEACCNISDVDVVFQFYLEYFKNEHGIESDPQVELDGNKPKVRFEDGGHPGDGKMETRILFEDWSAKSTETHWIFQPLENLYKRAVSTPGYVQDNLQILEQETRGCLSFIQHCLRFYCDSIIQTSQDLVTVYCRICRTFMLGTPHVYIDDVAAPILKDILSLLLQSKVLSDTTKTTFFKHKPSKSAAVTFYDFYTELVNEYFDNSYFNEVFAAYLFLPLRAIEDAKVKSYFWSHEYLQFVKLQKDQLLISVEYLTKTIEKDPEILSLFANKLKRKVITEEKNPFLYEVLVTQLKNSNEYITAELRKDLDLLSL